MPYVKTVWETGDQLTATGLNNMEDGIANAVSNSEGAVTTANSASSTATTAANRIENMTMTINDDMELVVTF